MKSVVHSNLIHDVLCVRHDSNLTDRADRLLSRRTSSRILDCRPGHGFARQLVTTRAKRPKHISNTVYQAATQHGLRGPAASAVFVRRQRSPRIRIHPSATPLMVPSSCRCTCCAGSMQR